MITVFGSINLDLVVRVSRLPDPGETVPGSGFATAPGGKGANQALAARRAGSAVRMIGAVGSDAFAAEALALLKAGGVDLERVRTVPGPTGVALIQVDDTGENTIAVVPGANGEVVPADAKDLTFSAGDALLLQLEVPVPAIEAAAARARSAGAAVLLNFAPFRSNAIELARQATHLIVNESECALVAESLGLPGGTVTDQARSIAGKSACTVVVTLGREGTFAVSEDGEQGVPALVVDAVDTVGAGDTFCGYLAAGISGGMALGDALRRASAAGSLACTKPGAQPAIPHRSDVDAALRG
jgi:ribokinase